MPTIADTGLYAMGDDPVSAGDDLYLRDDRRESASRPGQIFRRALERQGDGSVVPGASPRLQILVPLPRQQRLLLRVAVLAGGNGVAAHGASAADQGHEVIHRERSRADLPLAVVADAGRDPPLPPRAGAQLARSRLLAFELGVADLGGEANVRRHDSPFTVESRSESSSHSFMSQATRSSVSLRAWAASRARPPSR